MLLLMIIYCIHVNFEGDNDLDSFSWNHVLISSFQAPTSIHDRDINSNLNQHNNTTFYSNQQNDMFKSSTADSYERLLKKTSRMIQSIISLYDTPPQATEQKSSASSSSSSSPSTTTTTYRDDCDDYTLRVDDLVAEGLDHHCEGLDYRLFSLSPSVTIRQLIPILLPSLLYLKYLMLVWMK